MKKIKVISLGGTISALGKNRLDLKDYTSGKLTGEEILSAIPEVHEFAHISFTQLDNVSSTAINAQHWTSLRDKIYTYIHEDDYDGVVITHGTNTLEETAYFLHLTANTNKPIVLTGAQRPFSALGTDALMNLYQAILVASSKESKGKGVLVVLNGKISCARNVTKTNTYSLEAFQSQELGFLGFVGADASVVYYQEPLRKHTVDSQFARISLKDLEDVAILYSHAGASGDLIEFVANSGKYAGIVMAGTGAGRFSPLEDAALQLAEEKGLIIVRSSRVAAGSVYPIDHYSFLPAISADNLSAQQARVLLMLSLQVTRKRELISKFFKTY